MTALVRYEQACRALAEAKSVDEVKGLRDKAIAMSAYARQAKNRELEFDAVEIRVRAERRLGEMLSSEKDAGRLGPGQPPKNGLDKKPFSRIQLANFGIDKNLSFRSQKLAGIPDDRFEQFIADARDSVNRAVKSAIRSIEIESEGDAYIEQLDDGCTVADLDSLIASGKKYSVIYADPPWSFNVYSGKGKIRSADRHYDTQSLDDIRAMPVAQLAADDCALMMWAVMPELPGALEVIKAWGFTYKTVAFTWVKENRSGNGLFWGMGYWTRANAEVCLLATRGAPKRQAMDVHQIIMSPVSEHSRKPDEAQVRIERLLPGPYLELYGRRPTPGWTVWGNQISRNLFQQEIPEFIA